MDKQINHDKFHDESKTRTHRLNKLPDDGDPLAPNNLLTLEQKKKTPVEPRSFIISKYRIFCGGNFSLTLSIGMFCAL